MNRIANIYKYISLNLFLIFSANAAPLNQEMLKEKIIEKLSSYISNYSAMRNAIIFSNYELDFFAPNSENIIKNQGYKKSVETKISSDGKFNYNITYLQGEGAGNKYTICYDGLRSFLSHAQGKVNNVFTQKGKLSTPLIYSSNAIFEPFSFVLPSMYNTNDKGTYLTIDQLINKELWQKWFDNVQITESSEKIVITKKIESKDGFDGCIIVFISSLSYLPYQIDIVPNDNSNNITKKITWQDCTTSNQKYFQIPNKITIEKKYDDGSTSKLISEIESVKINNDIDINTYSYDLKNATSIYDCDAKLLIPRNDK